MGSVAPPCLLPRDTGCRPTMAVGALFLPSSQAAVLTLPPTAPEGGSCGCSLSSYQFLRLFLLLESLCLLGCETRPGSVRQPASFLKSNKGKQPGKEDSGGASDSRPEQLRYQTSSLSWALPAMMSSALLFKLSLSSRSAGVYSTSKMLPATYFL